MLSCLTHLALRHSFPRECIEDRAGATSPVVRLITASALLPCRIMRGQKEVICSAFPELLSRQLYDESSSGLLRYELLENLSVDDDSALVLVCYQCVVSTPECISREGIPSYKVSTCKAPLLSVLHGSSIWSRNSRRAETIL